MSQENVDAWRRILAAYDRRDRSAFLAEMHHDVETIPLAEWPEPGPYVGEDVWNFHVAFADAWGEATPPRPTELLDFGDKLVACLERTARGGESRISVTYSVYGVITFRDEKVARLQWFTRREEALAAAGCGRAGTRRARVLARGESENSSSLVAPHSNAPSRSAMKPSTETLIE